MAILYRVVAAVGKYTDNEGKEKGRYVDMGVVMETKNGPMLKLESIPAAGWDGWAYLNDPQKREEGSRKPAPKAAKSDPGDEYADAEIPF